MTSELGGALLYQLANSAIDRIVIGQSCWRFGWPDYGDLTCDLYYLGYALSDLVDLTCERHEREFLHVTFQNNRTGKRKMIMVKHFTLTIDWLRQIQVTVTQTRFCRLVCQGQLSTVVLLALAKRGSDCFLVHAWWSRGCCFLRRLGASPLPSNSTLNQPAVHFTPLHYTPVFLCAHVQVVAGGHTKAVWWLAVLAINASLVPETANQNSCL